MTQRLRPSSLALAKPDTIHRVREVLDRAGFDEPHIAERLGSKEVIELAFGPLDCPRLLRRTRDGDPLSTLIRRSWSVRPSRALWSARPSSPWTRWTGSASA